MIALATESFRTEKVKICDIAPGMLTIASSPSHVLQIHPFFENFCTKPTRNPLEYEKLSAMPAQIVNTRTGTMITVVSVSFPQFLRAKPRAGAECRSWFSGAGVVIRKS